MTITANRVASASPDNDSFLAEAFDPAFGVTPYSASGAIGVKEGLVVLTPASALAMTLVAPTAGLPSAGGDDGKRLHVVSLAAEAHTITCPSDGINGNKHVATFSAIADHITLTAYNGVWYATDNSTTLS